LVQGEGFPMESCHGVVPWRPSDAGALRGSSLAQGSGLRKRMEYLDLVWRLVGLAYRLAKGLSVLPRDGLVGRVGAVVGYESFVDCRDRPRRAVMAFRFNPVSGNAFIHNPDPDPNHYPDPNQNPDRALVVFRIPWCFWASLRLCSMPAEERRPNPGLGTLPSSVHVPESSLFGCSWRLCTA
jgi:hypothetical protein